MTRVNNGADVQARQMGGDVAGATGTSTGVTATTLTDSGASWTTNAFVGHMVFTGAVWGVVVSNTGTVLTVDKWYAPATPGGAAASTPSTGVYVVGFGNAPAQWLALSTNASAVNATDTTLTSELNNAGGGLNRALGTYAHTTAATSFTLTKTFTANGSDPGSSTINKMGTFQHSSGGSMIFSSLVSSPPTMISGDTLTLTETVNI